MAGATIGSRADGQTPAHQYHRLKPLTPIVPDLAASRSTSGAHSRSRTASSSVFPLAPPLRPPPAVAYPIPTTFAPAPAAGPTSRHSSSSGNRRTLSNATISSSATHSTTGAGAGVGAGGMMPTRSPSTATSLQRSASSRSGGSPSGYVALMRKQKATVWCDRSQHEDPRLLAQQKAARLRAARQVVGPASRSSTATSASLSGATSTSRRIGRHGKSNNVSYTPASLVGGVGSVPLRLSASEVGDEGNGGDDAESQHHSGPHRRTASGRSSLGSGRRSTHLEVARGAAAGGGGGGGAGGGGTGGGRQSLTMTSRFSGGATLVSSGASATGLYYADEDVGSHAAHDDGDGEEDVATPMPHHHPTPPRPREPPPPPTLRLATGGYFHEPATGFEARDALHRGEKVAQRTLTSPPAAAMLVPPGKSDGTPDELRRRGSVDDRAMTMSSGVRLFVANPDLSD
ncbi:MAG: hypothetical protein M1826_006900 [Phylliscum demangeonii]|nr:MAG: hypothetical protein M1826_006900 [Phylliscum demangeonii]